MGGGSTYIQDLVQGSDSIRYCIDTVDRAVLLDRLKVLGILELGVRYT